MNIHIECVMRYRPTPIPTIEVGVRRNNMLPLNLRSTSTLLGSFHSRTWKAMPNPMITLDTHYCTPLGVLITQRTRMSLSGVESVTPFLTLFMNINREDTPRRRDIIITKMLPLICSFSHTFSLMDSNFVCSISEST